MLLYQLFYVVLHPKTLIILVMSHLDNLINESISKIQHAEKLALSLQPDAGFWVAFSGGKDSQVLLKLVQLAGVKYQAIYNVTTNDPPENVYFIRKEYKEVIFNHPSRNFYKLIEKKGLPTIFHRFCCEYLKESSGAGFLVLTGVRREESAKRAKYDELAIISRRKEHSFREEKVSIDSLLETNHSCIRGKDKITLRPILDWSNIDIWDFIKSFNLPINPCYSKFGRVGCMFCPFSSVAQIRYYEAQYPKFKELIIKSMDKYVRNHDCNLLTSADDYYEWWLSKKSTLEYIAAKKQLSLNFD